MSMINNNGVVYGVPVCDTIRIWNMTTGVSDSFKYFGDNGYPLTRGPGDYEIRAYSGGRIIETYNTRLEKEHIQDYTIQHNVFVNKSIGYELLEYYGLSTINEIFDFAHKKIQYDHIKAFLSKSSKLYVPDLYEIAIKKRGICWDKVCLFAAMCRAMGVPCQICVGQLDLTKDKFQEYHAWCRVKVDNKWKTIDPTNGKKYKASAYHAERFY